MKIEKTHIAMAWIAVASAMMLYAYTERALTIEEFRRYVHDGRHGLHLSHEVNSIRIDLQYTPTDLVVQEFHTNSSRPLNHDSLRAELSRFHYMTLAFSRNGRELLQPAVVGERYSELLQLFSFRMHEYVRLVTPNDTLPLADYHLDHTFGMGTATTLLLVFEKEKEPTPWLQLMVDEFGLGVGDQNFKVLSSNLDKLPQVRGHNANIN